MGKHLVYFSFPRSQKNPLHVGLLAVSISLCSALTVIYGPFFVLGFRPGGSGMAFMGPLGEQEPVTQS